MFIQSSAVTQKSALNALFKDAVNYWDWASQRRLTHPHNTKVEIFKGKFKKINCKFVDWSFYFIRNCFRRSSVTVMCDKKWNSCLRSGMKRGSGNGYSWMVANSRARFLSRHAFCTYAKRGRGGDTVSSAITRVLLRRTGARCLQNPNFRLRVLAIARFQRPLLRYKAV